MPENKVFEEPSLPIKEHLDPDKHWIGESLPSASMGELATNSGAINHPGVSKFPAHADHQHLNDWASGYPLYDARYVNVTGDTMTGELMIAQPVGGSNGTINLKADLPLIQFYRASDGARRAYIWSHSGGLFFGAELSGAMRFGTGGIDRLDIAAAGDISMHGRIIFNTAGTGWFKPSSGNACLQLARDTNDPYVSFTSNDWATRYGYIQVVPSVFAIGSDAGSIDLRPSGTTRLALSSVEATFACKVLANQIPTDMIWDKAHFIAYCNSTDNTKQARISFLAGTAAPQLRSVHTLGQKIGVIAWDSGSYAPIEASAFPVGSSIKTKKEVRSLREKTKTLKSVKKLQTLADTIDDIPDFMSLRPVVFRPKEEPMIIEQVDKNKEINLKDNSTWKATKRDLSTPLGIEATRERLGLIAEEVQTIIPSAVSIDEDGNATGIDYAQVTVALIDHVQKLTDEVEALKELVGKK